jgi:hypothetical protein
MQLLFFVFLVASFGPSGALRLRDSDPGPFFDCGGGLFMATKNLLAANTSEQQQQQQLLSLDRSNSGIGTKRALTPSALHTPGHHKVLASGIAEAEEQLPDFDAEDLEDFPVLGGPCATMGKNDGKTVEEEKEKGGSTSAPSGCVTEAMTKKKKLTPASALLKPVKAASGDGMILEEENPEFSLSFFNFAKTNQHLGKKNVIGAETLEVRVEHERRHTHIWSGSRRSGTICGTQCSRSAPR